MTSALTHVDPKDKYRGQREVQHAEREHGCDCQPHADVQEGGVSLSHSEDCSAFGLKALHAALGK